MSIAEKIFEEIKTIPVVKVSDACYLAILSSGKCYEYTDSKNCFLSLKTRYPDDSTLNIHRNGNVTVRTHKILSEINLYTHIRNLKNDAHI